MSLIPLASALIRRAASDESYAQDLQESVAVDETAFAGLVRGQIEQTDLRWLSPSEWLWFGRWRQGMGGPLDELLLDYIAFTATSRFSRFELRGLVMRDPRSVENATAADVSNMEPNDTGLRWLRRHATQFPDSLELARDALQYATPAAWFTLSILTSLDDPRGSTVRDTLRAFAEERGLDSEVTSEWTRFDH